MTKKPTYKKRVCKATDIEGEAFKSKQAEMMTRSKEAQYRKIFDYASDGLIVTDLNGNIVEANPRACEMYGYPYEELITLSAKDLVHPDNRHLFGKFLSDVKKEGKFASESRDMKKDGTPIIVEVRGTEFDYNGKSHFLAIIRDITERKRAEKELRRALSEIKQLKERLEAENIYLREEIQIEHTWGEIVGQSNLIKMVMRQAQQVADTNSTVLIQGETGTGKELLARAIHNWSSRKGRAMVKVNCAALPSTLVESELFGHEKGAYTGALAKQVGRFEIANGSTIFLDEITALSMDLQAKLLRVLEEGEFERVGSSKTIKVDVRVIAATNLDVAKAVQEGRFRDDLYFRLNVFPISLPPLRDRKEDIPLLVWGFIKEFGETMRKTIDYISRKSMNSLQRYPWPGNIRELRNVIERAIILSKDSTLRVALPETDTSKIYQNMTLEEVEKKHIINVLQSTGWRVRGKNGAAEILGLKPTTLDSRIKKLGIQRTLR